MASLKGETATILIVDDQLEMGQLMQRIVQCMGHHPVYVDSGAGALNFVDQCLPSAVLLDYMMPEMDGLQVLKLLRSDPRTQNLPVVIFSANSDPKILQYALQNGANDYRVKGALEMEELEIRLSRLLTTLESN